MATITKRELVIRVSDETGIKQQTVLEVIQRTLDAVSDALASGDTVTVRRFGVFQVRETKPKVGRNPKAPDQEVVIPARATVKFKPANALKAKVEPVLPKLRENSR